MLEIRTRDRQDILGLRIHVLKHLISRLRVSSSLIPPKPAEKKNRGEYESRHYVCWADYSKHPYMSKELLDDGTVGEAWCSANVDLFKYLSDELRLWDPQAYEVMTDTPWLDRMISKGAYHVGQKGQTPLPDVPLSKVAGIWHGLVINRGQTRAGEPHRDHQDAKLGYNCVVPHGDWSGGDRLLWDLKMQIELRAGDAFIFRGSLLTHNAYSIVPGGVRNGVDLFTHQNLLNLDKAKRRYGNRPPAENMKRGRDSDSAGTNTAEKSGKNKRQRK